MFHDIPISLTSFNVSKQRLDKFYGEFFTKISSTNQCGKFLFSFLPCHMGKAKLTEVFVQIKK